MKIAQKKRPLRARKAPPTKRGHRTYSGHVRGGVVVLDEKLKLPEGTHVIVQEDKIPHDPTGIAGSWVDERSAEEIVADIRASRESK